MLLLGFISLPKGIHAQWYKNVLEMDEAFIHHAYTPAEIIELPAYTIDFIGQEEINVLKVYLNLYGTIDCLEEWLKIFPHHSHHLSYLKEHIIFKKPLMNEADNPIKCNLRWIPDKRRFWGEVRWQNPKLKGVVAGGSYAMYDNPNGKLRGHIFLQYFVKKTYIIGFGDGRLIAGQGLSYGIPQGIGINQLLIAPSSWNLPEFKPDGSRLGPSFPNVYIQRKTAQSSFILGNGIELKFRNGQQNPFLIKQPISFLFHGLKWEKMGLIYGAEYKWKEKMLPLFFSLVYHSSTLEWVNECQVFIHNNIHKTNLLSSIWYQWLPSCVLFLQYRQIDPIYFSMNKSIPDEYLNNEKGAWSGLAFQINKSLQFKLSLSASDKLIHWGNSESEIKGWVHLEYKTKKWQWYVTIQTQEELFKKKNTNYPLYQLIRSESSWNISPEIQYQLQCFYLPNSFMSGVLNSHHVSFKIQSLQLQFQYIWFQLPSSNPIYMKDLQFPGVFSTSIYQSKGSAFTLIAKIKSDTKSNVYFRQSIRKTENEKPISFISIQYQFQIRNDQTKRKYQ